MTTSNKVSLLNAAVHLAWLRCKQARHKKQTLNHFLFCAPIVSHITWSLWKLRSRIQYTLTGKCGNMCETVEPFGFVPEAECPIHDK